MAIVERRVYEAAVQPEVLIKDDENVWVIAWGSAFGLTLPKSGWRLACVYLETLGAESTLTPYQLKYLQRFEPAVNRFSAMIVQTPGMLEAAKARGWPVIVSPTGWDPDVMGHPDFAAQKNQKLTCYGTKYGHRLDVMPKLIASFGTDLAELAGCFGSARKKRLDRSGAVLTVLHCLGGSYPTMRLWQAASSAAAMISELSSDSWPAVEGEHYFGIDPISPTAVDVAIERIQAILADAATLRAMAERAHGHLRRYTPLVCMQEYIAPGLESLPLGSG